MTFYDAHRLMHRAEILGRQLVRHGWMLVTAESCTGGGIAACITDIPGSSDWFERGFITYSNTSKVELLDVPENVLAQYGAVSQQTVAAMLEGAIAHSQAQCAIAVSGIAGPGGGTTQKPVGTVWLGWQWPGAEPLITRYCYTGSRTAIRQQAIWDALRFPG